MIPEGVYVLEFHQAWVNSWNFFCLSISFASLNPFGNDMILVLLGLSILATALAASLPALSLSKHRTTFSNDSTNSILSRISLTAAEAPRFRDTTDHLPWKSSCTAIASHSPSVIVRYLPPVFPYSCSPNKPVSSNVPLHAKFLLATNLVLVPTISLPLK